MKGTAGQMGTASYCCSWIEQYRLSTSLAHLLVTLVRVVKVVLGVVLQVVISGAV